MNHLHIPLAILLCCLGFPVFSYSQNQTYLGFSGSGWPSNLQVRGVFQGAFEKKNIGQQLEIGYVRRENFTIRHPLSNGAYYFQPLIGAVELSTFFKMSINFEQFRLFGLIGPSLSHGVEAEAFIAPEGGGDIYRAVIPWHKLGVRRWEAGAYTGFGIESIGKRGVKILIDYRYYFGLTDLLTGDVSAYNQGSLLGIGIGLPLKRQNIE